MPGRRLWAILEPRSNTLRRTCFSTSWRRACRSRTRSYWPTSSSRRRSPSTSGSILPPWSPTCRTRKAGTLARQCRRHRGNDFAGVAARRCGRDPLQWRLRRNLREASGEAQITPRGRRPPREPLAHSRTGAIALVSLAFSLDLARRLATPSPAPLRQCHARAYGIFRLPGRFVASIWPTSAFVCATAAASARSTCRCGTLLYQVRNFAANIEDVRAQDASGAPAVVFNTKTSEWEITAPAGCVVVSYDIHLDGPAHSAAC